MSTPKPVDARGRYASAALLLVSAVLAASTSFSPDAVLAREQMTAFLARLYKALAGVAEAPVVDTSFTDVKEEDFAKEDTARVEGLGITDRTGSTSFSPDSVVAREQTTAFLARLCTVLAEERPHQ